MVARVIFFDTDEFVVPSSVQTLTAELVAEIEPFVRDQLPMLASRLNLSVYPGRRVIPETGRKAGRAPRLTARDRQPTMAVRPSGRSVVGCVPGRPPTRAAGHRRDRSNSCAARRSLHQPAPGSGRPQVRSLVPPAPGGPKATGRLGSGRSRAPRLGCPQTSRLASAVGASRNAGTARREYRTGGGS